MRGNTNFTSCKLCVCRTSRNEISRDYKIASAERRITANSVLLIVYTREFSGSFGEREIYIIFVLFKQLCCFGLETRNFSINFD